MQKVLHSPTLATVLMVERTLKNAGQVMKVAELKRKLPKKVMHQTLLHILDYLQHNGKIVIGTKGILYTYTPKAEMEKWIKDSLFV